MRPLIIAAAVCLLIIGAVDVRLSRLRRAPFLPERRMRKAAASPQGCTVLFGGSRMDAAFDEASFQDGLRARGVHACVLSLATWYTDISSHFLPSREYRRRGGKPSM